MLDAQTLTDNIPLLLRPRFYARIALVHGVIRRRSVSFVVTATAALLKCYAGYRRIAATPPLLLLIRYRAWAVVFAIPSRRKRHASGI